ncbi:MAG: alpha/beta fold hydrolase, partial [Pseudomonadota bacterium]
MKRKTFGWKARRVVVALAAAPGCAEQGAPEPSAASNAIAALERFSYQTQDGLTIAAMRRGEGRRVIFVHGTPGDKELWADYLLDPPFPAEFVAIDRPGFGGSDPKDAVTDLEAQAAALLPLLE